MDLQLEMFNRTGLLVGTEALSILKGARILVFGLGGVGSYVVEGLARSGVGTLAIVDRDVVAVSNINRQLIALCSTVGMPKTQASAIRLRDINPNINVREHSLSFDELTPDTEIDFSEYDYVVDAIDSIDGKLEIIKRAHAVGTRVISCMGTGFKLDSSRLKIADIYQTTVCPLSRIMRKHLRAMNIPALKVLYSDEPHRPICQSFLESESTHYDSKNDQKTDPQPKQKTVASISFVPSVAGLMIAGEVVLDLIRHTL